MAEMRCHQAIFRIVAQYTQIWIGSIVKASTFDMKDQIGTVTDFSIDTRGNISATVTFNNAKSTMAKLFPNTMTRKLALTRLKLA